MQSETLICPFCGAPHREVIPSGTVQVKCKYCGGTILVPASLGGAKVRCPNHPEVLAVGLCNDCGGSFCDNCLYFFDVKGGRLHLCPDCFRERQVKGAIAYLIIGGFLLLMGFFLFGSPSPGEGLVYSVVAIGAGFIAIFWGVYRVFRSPKGVTIRGRTEAIKTEIEFRRAFGVQATPNELYNRLLSDSMQSYGPQIGVQVLERQLDLYVHAGMTRNQALKKIAEDKGYLRKESKDEGGSEK